MDMFWFEVLKLTFDVALIVSVNSMNNIVSSSFSNNKRGVNQLLKYLKKQGIKNLNDELLICMKHTGMYSRVLVNNLSKFTTNIWVENAYSINIALEQREEKLMQQSYHQMYIIWYNPCI